MRTLARGAATALLLLGALAQSAPAASIGWVSEAHDATGASLRRDVVTIAARRGPARGGRPSFHANNFRRDVRGGARRGWGGGDGGDWGPSWGGLAVGAVIGAGIASAAIAAANAGASYPAPPPYGY